MMIDPMSIGVMFLKKYLKHIIIGIVIIALLVSGYYKIYNDGYKEGINEEKVKTLNCQNFHKSEVIRITEANKKELLIILNKYNIAAEDLQNTKESLKPKYKIIYDTVIKEIEKPIYEECKIPKSGLDIHLETTKILNESRK